MNESKPLELSDAILAHIQLAAAPLPATHRLDPVQVLSSIEDTLTPLRKQRKQTGVPDGPIAMVRQALAEPMKTVLQANLGHYIDLLIKMWCANGTPQADHKT